MLGKTLLIFTGAIVVIGLTLFLIIRCRRGANVRDDTENVADLNDRFNRARYMDRDGE